MHHHALPRLASILLLLAAVSWGSAQDCLARIGETQDQCIKRYGKPAFEGATEEAGMTEIVWNKSGLRIRALFPGENSACGKISFQKGNSSELPPEEIKPLLKDNSLGSEWVMVCNSGDTTQWLTSDFTLRAYYHKTKHVLTIEAEK